AAAEWFRWMSRNGLITDWEQFKESVINHFRPSKYEYPQGALSKLLQLGSVEEYQGEFEKLMNQARLDDKAALVAGTTAKPIGNHGGDESESSGPVTPTEEDDQSFEEKESYLSGDQYFLSKQIMMDEDELNLLRPNFVPQEFISQTNEFIIIEGQVLGKTSLVHMDDFCIDEDQHGSV
ncbi:protein kinase, catalytic domain-containing protein, partial [Tanacetum coccineum]